MKANFSKFIIKSTNAGDFDGINNSRMAAFLAQDGLCFVTGLPLLPGKRQLHHRTPRSRSGDDSPANLVYLQTDIHVAVHSYNQDYVKRVCQQHIRTDLALALFNQLRHEAGMKLVRRIPAA